MICSLVGGSIYCAGSSLIFGAPVFMSGFTAQTSRTWTVAVSASGADKTFCGQNGFQACATLAFAISSTRQPHSARIWSQYTISGSVPAGAISVVWGGTTISGSGSDTLTCANKTCIAITANNTVYARVPLLLILMACCLSAACQA